MSMLTCTAMSTLMNIHTNTHMEKTPVSITMNIQKNTVLMSIVIRAIKVKRTAIPIKTMRSSRSGSWWVAV
jgi:hypothetical protein